MGLDRGGQNLFLKFINQKYLGLLEWTQKDQFLCLLLDSWISKVYSSSSAISGNIQQNFSNIHSLSMQDNY